MKKNIIIFGGELYNKGAQAMAYALIDHLKRTYPEKEIYLFSGLDYRKKSIEEKKKYKFNFMDWDSLRLQLRMIKPLNYVLKCKGYNQDVEDQIREILKETEMAFDINGYALSSQFSFSALLRYVSNIKLMKNNKIKVFILPQSLGPFEYKGIKKIFADILLNKYLKYPEKIFAREFDGFERVKKYSKENLEKSVDLVLQTPEPNLKLISKEKLKKFDIEENSVGIMPNVRLKKHNQDNDVLEIYRGIIKDLISRNKNVYIVRHSYEDKEFCNEIGNLFAKNKLVKVIDQDLNCVELNEILKKFDYTIAARYHAVVHSFKNEIPSFILGWAVKYQEIASLFNQEKYVVDIREKIDIEEIKLRIKYLENNLEKQKLEIKEKMDKLKLQNILKGI